MSLEFLILGVIQASPKTGYDLHKVFENGLQSLWTAEQRQIYHALHKLEEQGYVACEMVVQDGSPNKKVYSVTSEGQKALKDWITMPLPQQPTRKDWLGQIYLSNFVDPDDILPLLRSWQERLVHRRIELEEDLAIYRARIHDVPEQNQEYVIKLKVLEYNFMQNYHDFCWVDNLIAFFENLGCYNPNDLVNSILRKYPKEDFQTESVTDIYER